MSEDEKTKNTNSHTGWWVSGGILVPLLYVLSPPFVVKLLLVSGMTMLEIGNLVEHMYAPLVYIIENEVPGYELLGNYYDWCFTWIGIK